MLCCQIAEFSKNGLFEMQIFKNGQFSDGIDFSMVLIETEIGLFDQKQAETIFYTTSVYRV